jgi:hypothetical protein
MGPLDFTFGLLLLGIVKMLTSAFASRGALSSTVFPTHPRLVAEPRAAQNDVRALEIQLHDARLQNDQLHKQLEWHNKLLETQDRLIDRVGTAHTRPPLVTPS